MVEVPVTNNRPSLEKGVSTLYPELPPSQVGYMARLINSRLSRIEGGDTATFLLTKEQPDSKPLFYVMARSYIIFVSRAG